MRELFSGFDRGELYVLLFFGGLMVLGLTSVAAVLAYHVRRLRQLAAETALKQDMIQRGHSAADIERVLRATSPEPHQGEDAPAVEADREMTDEEAEAQVAAALVTLGVDTDEIEPAVAAVRAAPRGTKLAVARMVAKLADEGADEAQVLAAINALCRSPADAVLRG